MYPCPKFCGIQIALRYACLIDIVKSAAATYLRISCANVAIPEYGLLRMAQISRRLSLLPNN